MKYNLKIFSKNLIKNFYLYEHLYVRSRYKMIQNQSQGFLLGLNIHNDNKLHPSSYFSDLSFKGSF